MTFALGLLAAALFGADAPATPPSPEIQYEIKVVVMEGLDWRSSMQHKLQYVAKQGDATIWTVPSGVVASLLKQSSHTIAAPKITANSQVPAHFSMDLGHVRQRTMTRTLDFPINQTAYTAKPTPATPNPRDAISATMSARKLDQGILACIALDDREIAAIHEVKLADTPETSACPECDECAGESPCQELQIPETSHCQVTGEWLIPNGGALVVSCGVHTMADSKGKAVARERVAIFEAKAGESRMPTKPAAPAAKLTYGYRVDAADGKNLHYVFQPRTATNPGELGPFIVTSLPIVWPVSPAPGVPTYSDDQLIPMPTPAPPSRAQTRGWRAIGQPEPLPPLPPGSVLPSPAAALKPGSAPAQPLAAKTKADPAMVRASAVEPVVASVLSAMFPKKSSNMAGWIPLGKGKTFDLEPSCPRQCRIQHPGVRPIQAGRVEVEHDQPRLIRRIG